MTHDKIRHYLGDIIINHLNTCDKKQLERQLKAIEQDVKLLDNGSEILFKRNVELQYINQLLN